jgi:glycosyltransferase involved in cell wall biosynthesis
MSKQTLVTIGLPVYNSEKYLEQSLRSLLDQTYADFELIISDNASTDRTGEICRTYASEDSRIRYLRNDENIGNPGNFNRIARLTETPYLKWSTADDYWDTSFLEKAIPIMESDSEIALCYPKTYLVDADGRNPEPYEDNLHLVDEDPEVRFRKLLAQVGLSHQHLGVIRCSALKRTHLLGSHVTSDINLLAELTLYGKFYELPERLFYRRFHKDSGSWKRGDADHEARTYYAAKPRAAAFAHWRWHAAFFKAVAASDLSLKSKSNLYTFLTRRALWDRRNLVEETKDYARGLLATKGG